MINLSNCHTKKMHTITGIITTYNRTGEIVERAINSMLTQTHPVSEIIVIDDNENDSPICDSIATICSRYDLVTYIKQNGNKGACAARNLGIQNAHSDYVAFLDDDDEWLPTKLERQIELFQNGNDSVGLVSVSGYILFEDTGKETEYYNYYGYREHPTYQDMLEGDWVGSTSQPLIKKECFDNVGMFSEDQPARQDYEMWIRIARGGYGIVCVKDQLFIHRIHLEEQISKNPEKARQGYKNIYKWYYKDIRKNPIAENSILRGITCNRGNECILRYLKYYFIRCIDKAKIFFSFEVDNK